MIFILTKFYGYSFHPYYNEVGFHRIILDFTNKSHISNSIAIYICNNSLHHSFIHKKTL